MKKLLLTGFEPFLNYSTNPTMEIVESLHERKIGQYTIHSEILPVEFKVSGLKLMEHIEKIQPDAIISLGLAGGRPQFTPERIAININDGPVDNSGYAPVDEEIIEGGADGYFTTLPIRKMVEALKEEGLPAKISNTAGAYLCNHVMYRALHYANQQEKLVRAGFLHIPASHELAIEQKNMPSWSKEDLRRAVLICIEVLSEE